MRSAAQLSWTDNEPRLSSFLSDVLDGFAATPRRVPAKYFYDAAGSELFERITTLPEYYLTRTEIGILRTNARAIIEACGGDGFALVEFGSGSSTKVRILFDAMRSRDCYVPVDISPELLRVSAEELTREYPDLRVAAVCADYTQPFDMPDCHAERKVIFFPGSTIGNMEPDEARGFIANAAQRISPGDSMIVGFDLKKDPAILNAAYNDAAGVTAEFNRNLLARMNRELDADFDLSRFEHHAFYDEAHGRVEMHLRSLVAQRVTIAGRWFAFREGELLHTENSYKYSRSDMESIIEGTGFEAAECWTDDEQLFCVQRLVKR